MVSSSYDMDAREVKGMLAPAQVEAFFNALREKNPDQQLSDASLETMLLQQISGMLISGNPGSSIDSLRADGSANNVAWQLMEFMGINPHQTRPRAKLRAKEASSREISQVRHMLDNRDPQNSAGRTYREQLLEKAAAGRFKHGRSPEELVDLAIGDAIKLGSVLENKPHDEFLRRTALEMFGMVDRSLANVLRPDINDAIDQFIDEIKQLKDTGVVKTVKTGINVPIIGCHVTLSFASEEAAAKFLPRAEDMGQRSDAAHVDGVNNVRQSGDKVEFHLSGRKLVAHLRSLNSAGARVSQTGVGDTNEHQH